MKNFIIGRGGGEASRRDVFVLLMESQTTTVEASCDVRNLGSGNSQPNGVRRRTAGLLN